MKVGLKLPIVPEHIRVIKHKGCGDSTPPTPYRFLVLQIMTLVILVQISVLIGYPSVILSLALEVRDGRGNCMKVWGTVHAHYTDFLW
jgi:hypothetical protein